MIAVRGLVPDRRRLLFVAALVLAAVASIPAPAVIAQPIAGTVEFGAENFTRGTVTAGSIQTEGGFVAGPDGWDLAANMSGRATYTLHKQPGAHLAMALWMGSNPDVATSLELALDNGPFRVLGSGTGFAGQLIALPASTDAAAVVRLAIDARNRGPAEALVLDRLTWTLIQGGAPYPAPAFAIVALGAVAGLLAWAALHARPRMSRLGVAGCVGALVAVAAWLRLDAVVRAAHLVPPNPDTVAYAAWADQFQWWPLDRGLLCGCYGPREPAWIAVGHALFQLFGSSPFRLRAATALLSIGAVVLTVMAARRRLSFPVSLAAGLLVALNGPVISNATRGLRTELEMVLCLVLYLILDRPAVRQPVRQALLAGATGAALVFTRTFFLPAVLVAEVISLLVRRPPWRRALLLFAVAAGLPLVATAAQRIALYEQAGPEYGLTHDAFLDTDSYARWLANNEKFEIGRPLPHPELFPSRAEYDRNGPYFGPHITYTQYLFELHSPGEVAVDTAGGYLQVIANTGGFLALDPSTLVGDTSARAPALGAGLGPLLDIVVRFLGVVGLLGMLVSGRERPRNLLVPALFFGILGFAAFLYYLRLIEPYYNVVQAWPFFFIAAGSAAEGALRLALSPDARPRAGRLAGAAAGLARRPALIAGAVALVASLAAALAPDQGLRANWPVLLLAALAVAGAVWFEAGTGAAVLLASVAVIATPAAALVPTAAAIAVILYRRPPAGARRLFLAAALAAALVMAVAGALRPNRVGLELAALGVAVGVVVAAAGLQRRQELMAAVALVPVMLAAAGLAAALSQPGAWPPAFSAPTATLVCLPALAAIAARRPRPPRAAVTGAVAVTICLLALSIGSDAEQHPGASWRTYLHAPGAAVVQRIDHVSSADDHLWIYAHRASDAPVFSTAVTVDGVDAGTLDAKLPISGWGWVSVALPDLPARTSRTVRIQIDGAPDASQSYVEIGGMYASDPSLVGTLIGPGVLPGSMSEDPGDIHGTLLVLLGTAHAPHPPAGFPLPHDEASLAATLGLVPAGEGAAPAAARSEAGLAQLWPAALKVWLARPLAGVGNGGLARALDTAPAGFGPGLSARNQYLQTAAEWGIAGLAALLLCLAAAALAAARAAPPERLPLLVALAVAALLICFQAALVTPGAMAAFMALVALCVTGRPAGASPESGG